MVILKLSKYELNQFLYDVSCSDRVHGLILKLCYVYGRTIGDVAYLKKDSLDFEEGLITFSEGEVSFPIDSSLYEDLIMLCDGKSDEEYIFSDDIEPSEIMVFLNYLLYDKYSSFLKSRGVRLTTDDFRVLRGQHLYLDGVSLESLQLLYSHKNINSTKSLIDYDDLEEDESEDYDNIFNKYTDLNLFLDEDYSSYVNYYCVYGNHEALIEINPVDEIIYIEGDISIKKRLTFSEDFIFELKLLNYPGEYKIINGVKIMKN